VAGVGWSRVPGVAGVGWSGVPGVAGVGWSRVPGVAGVGWSAGRWFTFRRFLPRGTISVETNSKK
jgi:hypothetical protein